MLSKLQSKKEEGFTIIEVLIVLAIAGLIMLIVFLAVPALQRNQRNNARNADASKIAAAVTECLANRNGSTAASASGCGTPANISTSGLNTITGVTISGTDSTSLTSANVRYNAQCDAEGVRTAAGAAPSPRAFTVTFALEPAINRCING